MKGKHDQLGYRVGTRKFLFGCLFVLLILVGGGCTIIEKYSTPKAFDPLDLQKSGFDVVASLSDEGEAVRSRPINISFSSLYKIYQADNAQDRQLVLNVFPRKNLLVQFDAPVQNHANAYTQMGHVLGEPLSEVSLAVNGEHLIMNIRSSQGIFTVRHNGEYHEIFELEGSFPKYGLSKEPDTAGELSLDGSSATLPQIDLMVIYSTSARNAVGGSSNMNNLIALAIAETNQGFINSDVSAQVSLVHSQEVSTEPSSYSNALYCITEKSDACLDSIHTTRNDHYADIIVYIINNNTYCGLSWMITNFNEYSEQHAFSVVNWRCAASQYGLAREIGHILGAQIDRQAAGYDQGAFFYSYGYQAPNHSFRTIMAANCVPTSCPKINYWSNPSIRINGIATGIDSSSPNSADNHKTINSTANWVSDFRIPPSPPDQVTILTPEHESTHTTSPLIYAWLPDENASDYQVIIEQIGTGLPVFDAIVNRESLCDEILCAYAPDLILQPGDYRWHVTGINSIGTGEFSPYHNFYVLLPAPVQQLPQDGAVRYSRTPLFQWQQLQNASSYLLELRDMEDSLIFSAPVDTASACTSGICSYTHSNPLAVGNYQWRVAGKTSVTGVWSGFNLFSINKPPIPVIVGPVDGFATSDHTPNFGWNSIESAELFNIQVSPRSDFSIVPINHFVTQDWFAPGVAMINQSYWWRVRVRIENEWSEWSEVRTLSIFGPPGQPQPQALSPADNSSTNNPRPLFDWADVPTAERYRIHISEKPDFKILVVNQLITNSEFTPGIDINAGTYYWRVQAMGGGDVSWFSFTRILVIQPN